MAQIFQDDETATKLGQGKGRSAYRRTYGDSQNYPPRQLNPFVNPFGVRRPVQVLPFGSVNV